MREQVGCRFQPRRVEQRRRPTEGKTSSYKGKQVQVEFFELEVVEKSRWQWQPRKQEGEPDAWRRVPADSVGNHLNGDNRPWETDPKEEHPVGVGQGTGKLMSGEPGNHGRLKVKKMELQGKVTNIIKPQTSWEMIFQSKCWGWG